MGCDCLHFVARIMAAAGVPGVPDRLPRYRRDWLQHEDGDRLYQAIEALLPVVDAGINDPRDGDIFLFTIGRSASHPGIYFRRQIWHCTDTSGVIPEPFTLPRWHKRRAHNLRVVVR